jgi:DNA-binding ferritin-like protein (Dps family)
MEKIIALLKKKYTLSQTIESVKNIVKPVFMRLSLDKVVDKFNSFPEEYRTDWSKILMDVEKSRGILETLIKALFGVYGGDIVGLYDLNMTTARKDVTMIFANTKNKTQQDKLVKLIQQVLGSNYIVKLINSDVTTNREAEEDIKKVITQAKRENKKVVLVSNDMASRSFSVSEIDTVMLMFDRGNYATISQKISRVLTPGKTFNGEDKVFGNIISLSLDPNREDVNPIDEYFIYEAEKVEVEDLNDGIQRVLRSVQILTNGEGGEVELEKDIYGEHLINSSSLIKLGAESSKVDNVIVDVDLVKVLTGVEVTEGQKEQLMGIDSSEVKRTEDPTSTKEQKEVEKKVQDIRKKIKEVLKNIVENIVEISEINNCESNDIIETLDMIESKGYCEEVVFEVGVDCQTVKKVVLMGGISRKLLNTIISSYNSQEVVWF